MSKVIPFEAFELLKRQIVDPLIEANQHLKKELEEVKQQVQSQASATTAPSVNSAELAALKQELDLLRELVKNLKTTPDQYDLKKEFTNFADQSSLQLDFVSQPPGGKLLNQAFKACLRKDNPLGWQNYQFSPRVINQNFSLKEWISGSTAKFSIGSADFDNSFATTQPLEKKISLGTGTGKSTFFLRCLAHHNSGATLVVPYSSLIGSVLDSHNNWLTKVNSTDERVTKCLICEANHTGYETKHNAVSNMINIFTWWEFLETYVKNPTLIKPWVVFDEAHTDLPAYQALIKGLLEDKEKKRRKFQIVQMSATFGDLPTSRKLTGTIVDYQVSDFEKVLAKNPEIFHKKVLVFCDDLEELNLKLLRDNSINFLLLNDALKEYASDIVRSMKAPLLVFANRDYSVGFSFGDVNVISTGVATRTIVDERGKETSIKGVSDFADLLQERGRSARDPKHTGVWMSLVPEPKGFKGKLKDDYLGASLEKFFKGKEKEPKLCEQVLKIAKKPKPLPYLDPQEGNLNLNRVLVRSLKDKLDPTTLFKLLPSEKGKRQAGEIIFTNRLVKYFDQKQLPDLLIEATKDKITNLVKDYDWYHTPEEEDDWVFNNETDAKLVGFYLQAREEEKYECKIEDNSKLTIKFSPYTLDKNKVKI
jgi:hypothetical protein